MKKIISLSMCLVFLLLCGCSTVKSTVELKPKYSQTATVKMGDYSYSANVKFDGKSVYITPTSTNASGMTISCNGKEVTFSRRDMLTKADKSKVSAYNPAVLFYDAITTASDCKKVDNAYVFDGKTSVGNFTLTVNQSSELVSLNIPDADFSIEFDVNSK